MFKEEFEKLAGYEVSYNDYVNIIEPMYMATNLNKSEFVKTINKKQFALKTRKQLLNEIKKTALEVENNCGTTGAYEEEKELYTKLVDYAKRFHMSDKVQFNKYGYELPVCKRGCSFPIQAIILNYNYNIVERIDLVEYCSYARHHSIKP